LLLFKKDEQSGKGSYNFRFETAFAAPTELGILRVWFYKYVAPSELWLATNSAAVGGAISGGVAAAGGHAGGLTVRRDVPVNVARAGIA